MWNKTACKVVSKERSEGSEWLYIDIDFMPYHCQQNYDTEAKEARSSSKGVKRADGTNVFSEAVLKVDLSDG